MGKITGQKLKSFSTGGHYEEQALKVENSKINFLSHSSVVAKMIVKSIEKRHVKPSYIDKFLV